MSGYFNEPRIKLGPNLFSGAGNSTTNFSLNDAGDEFAISFIAPKNFNLAKVAVYIHSVTGTPVAYDIRIETDDGSGKPSGTLAWTNATAQIPSGASSGLTAELALTAAGNLTLGTIYHIRIKANTDPANTNFANMRQNGQIPPLNQTQLSTWSCTLASGGSGFTISTSPGIFVCVSGDATPLYFGQVAYTSALLTLTNTAWKGMKFVAPDNLVCWGCSFGKLNSTSAGAVAAKLIDGSNNILATGVVGAGTFDALTSRGSDVIFIFDTPVTLVKGNTYRCVWKDPAGVMRMDVLSALSGYQVYKPGTDQYIRTEGTSADGSASPTAWTDTDTDEIMQFVMYCSDVNASGGTTIIVIDD